MTVLWNSGNPVSGPELRETEAAARALQLELDALAVKEPDELPTAFSSMTPGRQGAVIILSDIMFFGRRRHIAELATSYRLPAVAWTRELAESGVLMTYGPNTIEMHRHAATYVDKVLRSASPGDLPIEQPSNFELVLNLKTARALGISIPRALQLRADHVIE